MPSTSCHRQAGARPSHASPELADIFRRHGQAYREAHRLSAVQLNAMRRIELCRTATLGGHLDRCDRCGHERNSYNSCCDRHCPKCQTLAKERWLEARQAELLPVPYFHSVFALPHDLNTLVLDNKVLLYNMLFSTVAEVLQEFAANPRWKLNGRLGFIAVLHTWSQTLLDHFHLHCLIPAGALSHDGTSWNSCPDETFLFDVRALGARFRGRFLAALKDAYKRGDLRFRRAGHLAAPRAFYGLIARLYRKNWVVYCKKPLRGPRHVLDYLARYTHRVAISNHRIRSLTDSRVTFSYRDRADHGRTKRMTLPADEFIRRFLLHVLPHGFRRIRHFGFLASAAKRHALPIIQEALGSTKPTPVAMPSLSVRELMQELTGIDISLCPHCGEGTMIKTLLLPRTMTGRDP